MPTTYLENHFLRILCSKIPAIVKSFSYQNLSLSHAIMIEISIIFSVVYKSKQRKFQESTNV